VLGRLQDNALPFPSQHPAIPSQPSPRVIWSDHTRTRHDTEQLTRHVDCPSRVQY
jgi:hypothetical protein